MDQQPQGSFTIHGQYVKDLSFENPKAPFSFQIQEPPAFEISVDVKSAPLENKFFEVVLHIVTKAMHENEALFAISLDYAGLFQIEVEDNEELEKILLVHCSNMLYPFARRVISDMTRDGGYPAVSLNPIDFFHLYMQKKDVGATEVPPPANIN